MVATLLPSGIDKRWTSRKLWLSVALAVFVVLNSEFGWLTQEEMTNVFKAIGLFIGFEGLADIAARFK